MLLPPTAIEILGVAREQRLPRKKMNEYLKSHCKDNAVLNAALNNPRGTDFPELLTRAALYELGPVIEQALSESLLGNQPRIPELLEGLARVELIRNYHLYAR